MKKLIGMVGVAVIAMAMFFSMNNNMDGFNSDADLASIMAINIANAEGSGNDCTKEPNYACNGHDYVIINCDEDKWYTVANCGD